MATTPAKVCSVCGEDVSSKPRTKDAQGRYTCVTCSAAKGSAPGSAPAARPASRSAAALGDGEDNSFILGLKGRAIPNAACPNCQTAIIEGSKICTACGYNIAEKRAMKTRVSVDPGVQKSGKGGGKAAATGFIDPDSDWRVSLITAGVCLVLIGVPLGMWYSGQDDGSWYTIGFIAYRLMALGVIVGAAYATFQESLIKAVLCVIITPYALYRAIVRSENAMLRGVAIAVTLAFAFFAYAAYQRAEERRAEREQRLQQFDRANRNQPGTADGPGDNPGGN